MPTLHDCASKRSNWDMERLEARYRFIARKVITSTAEAVEIRLVGNNSYT